MQKKPARTLFTTGYVRAKDLTNTDCARVDGRWMQVLDVYLDAQDITSEFGEEYAAEHYADPIRKLSTAPEQAVMVRFADDANSLRDDLTDVWRLYVEYDLIEIQVPLTASVA